MSSFIKTYEVVEGERNRIQYDRILPFDSILYVEATTTFNTSQKYPIVEVTLFGGHIKKLYGMDAKVFMETYPEWLRSQEEEVR